MLSALTGLDIVGADIVDPAPPYGPLAAAMLAVTIFCPCPHA
jgi:hypothetical protein